ncbi:MAG: Bax inhibitor-1 family protein [Anaerofustis sp.]
MSNMNYPQERQTYEQSFVSTMNRVYLLMFAGLFVTTLAALLVITVPGILYAIFSSSIAFYGLIIAEFALVFILSARIGTMASATALTLFFLYAFVNGLTLSSIFIVYEISSIYAAFGVTALTFGAMSLIGATTKRNLSGIGGYLTMGLIGVIIASVVNLFLGNSTLDIIISIVAILVFVGLTAYDTQKIKQMLQSADSDSYQDHTEIIRKISVIGALKLYLDFINLFLQILRLFGKRR